MEHWSLFLLHESHSLLQKNLKFYHQFHCTSQNGTWIFKSVQKKHVDFNLFSVINRDIQINARNAHNVCLIKQICWITGIYGDPLSETVAKGIVSCPSHHTVFLSSALCLLFILCGMHQITFMSSLKDLEFSVVIPDKGVTSHHSPHLCACYKFRACWSLACPIRGTKRRLGILNYQVSCQTRKYFIHP